MVARGLGLVMVVLAMAGCSSDAVPTAAVSGEVLLDNQPLANGNIQFVPESGDAPTAGAEIKDGKFEAAVPITKVRVQITASKVVGQRKAYDTPESPVVDEVVELIPSRYNVNSELTLDVQKGMEPVRYELSSK